MNSGGSVLRSLHKRIVEYIFDTSVKLQNRSFVVFSFLTLIALYAAVPYGIVMHEPITATISTLIGAIVFSLYVYHMFINNKIDWLRNTREARIISIRLPDCSLLAL